MSAIIYRATNKINRKCYIGFTTVGLNRRKQCHLAQANHGSPTHFHRALRKYGLDSFEWEILETCNDEKQALTELEPYYIKENNSQSCGYNMTCGGDGVRGYERTPESVEKWRKSIANTKRPQLSEEHKKKISIANKGTIHSEKTKRKIRLARSKQVMKPISEKTRKRMSQARIGINLSAETRQKISNYQKGNSNFIWTIQTPQGIRTWTKSIDLFAEQYNINNRTLRHTFARQTPTLSGFMLIKKEKK